MFIEIEILESVYELLDDDKGSYSVEEYAVKLIENSLKESDIQRR